MRREPDVTTWYGFAAEAVRMEESRAESEASGD